MKTLKKVTLIIGIILIGIFIGYKISEQKTKASNFITELKSKSTEELLDLYQKDKVNGPLILKTMVGKHEISEAQYKLITDFFWNGTVLTTRYAKDKLQSIYKLYDITTETNWVEFAPNNNQDLNDLNDYGGVIYLPKAVKVHNKTTSCYPIPMFLGFYNAMTNANDTFEVTKGSNYITDDSGATKLYTVVLFKLSIGGKTLYYDISTEPDLW